MGCGVPFCCSQVHNIIAVPLLGQGSNLDVGFFIGTRCLMAVVDGLARSFVIKVEEGLRGSIPLLATYVLPG